MRVYDINVVWLHITSNRRYLRGSQWHRGIKAETQAQACAAAMAQHTDKINPSVSLAWPIWPQPKEIL